MAYELSFAESFFWGDSSVSLEDLELCTRPTSVYQAILSIPEEKWVAIARDLFSVDPEQLASNLTGLNVSTSEDGAQEFAVVKIPSAAGAPFLQVESITFGWCSKDEPRTSLWRTSCW